MVDMIEDDTSTSAFNFYGVALKETVNRPFSVTHNAGHKLSSKPSLVSRINGVKEIQVYIPTNLTELDRYIFGNLVSYLQGLNIRVDVVQARYENSAVQMGTVQGYYRIFSNVQKITSAENLQSRASDEIVPFREFIIKDDTSALL